MSRATVLWLSLAALLIPAYAWHALGYPTSIDEARLIRDVSVLVSSGAQELKLSELMPGDWELVCESHGYDGPRYLKRYDKTFQPVAPPDDGAWGLIFISPDGTFRSAVGSCRSTSSRLYTNGCTERDNATLIREPGPEGCATYSVRAVSARTTIAARHQAARS